MKQPFFILCLGIVGAFCAVIMPPPVYGPFQKLKSVKVFKPSIQAAYQRNDMTNFVGIWIVETSTNLTDWQEVAQMCQPEFAIKASTNGARFWRARTYAEASR